MLALNATLPDFDDNDPAGSLTPRAASTSRSMAMTGQSHTERHSAFSVHSGDSDMPSENVFSTGTFSESSSDLPTLSPSGPSAVSSDVDTSVGEHIIPRAPLAVDASGHSVPAAVPDADAVLYPCALQWLDCGFVTDGFEVWKRHCKSHFYPHEPPTSFQCPLCAYRGGPYRSGYDAWEVRLNHVAIHHRQGHDLSTSRPDMGLITYLYKTRLISDRLYKSLRASGRVSRQVTTTNESARLRKQQQARH